MLIHIWISNMNQSIIYFICIISFGNFINFIKKHNDLQLPALIICLTIIPYCAPAYVKLCPIKSAESLIPPNPTIDSGIPNAVLILLANNVLPIPGGPTRPITCPVDSGF